MEIPSLEQFAQILIGTLDSSQEIRDSASSTVETFMSSIEYKPGFVLSCLSILKQPQAFNLSLLRQAIFYLCKAFSVDYYQSSWELWNILWRITEENKTPREEIKETCILLFDSPDESIRSLSSQLLAELSMYDRGIFKDTFHHLVEILGSENPSVSFISKLSSIRAIRHFFENKSYIESDANSDKEYNKYKLGGSFQKDYYFLMDVIVMILSNYQILGEDIIVEIYRTLSCFDKEDTESFLYVFCVLEERKPRNKENLDRIFQYTFEICRMHFQNENVIRSVHAFFYSLYETIYKNAMMFFTNENFTEERFNLAMAELMIMFDKINVINFPLILPPSNVSYIAVGFWDQIGKNEQRILTKNKLIKKFEDVKNKHNLKEKKISCNVKSEPFLPIFGRYMNELVPKLLKSMEYVDPDCLGDSDDVFVNASSAINMFFMLDPSNTLRFIFGYMNETLSSQIPVSWNIRYVQLQLISCVCLLSADDHDNRKSILDFLNGMYNLMLETLSQFKGFPFVVLAAVNAFSMAYRNYGLYLSSEMTNQVLASVVQLSLDVNSPPLIVATIDFMKSVIECFDKNCDTIRIDAIISPISSFISNLYKNADFIASNDVQNLFSLQESIVQHTNPSKNNNIIITIMKGSVQNFFSSTNFNVVIGELYVISSIMRDYGVHFVQEGLDVANKIISILNGPNQQIIEDCIVCLMLIVTGMKENAAPILPQLKQQLMKSYESQSPGIIIQVNRFIGSLFMSNGPLMFDVLEEAVNKILAQINEARLGNQFSIYFSKQMHFLIFPLSAILKSVPVESPLSKTIRDALFPVFVQTLPLFTLQNEEVKSVFLEAHLLGFSAIIDASAGDFAFLKANKNNLFAVNHYLAKLNEFPDSLIYAFCEFIRSAIIVMSPNPVLRIFIRRSDNLYFAVLAECSSNRNLSKIGSSLIEKLK